MNYIKYELLVCKKCNNYIIKYFTVLTFLVIILLLNGCKTVEKKIESENKFVFKEDAVFESKKAQSKLIIKKDKKDNKFYGYLTSPFIHWAKIKGPIEEVEEGYKLNIESFKILTNWPNGWTFGEYEASGIVVFKKGENDYNVEIVEPFELWDLMTGEIRYFDDYYRFEEGLMKVKNRMTRIRLVNKYLKENGFPEFYGHLYFQSSYGEPFKKSVRLFIFDNQRELPEEINRLVKSGTMKRDFEEACGLLFMDYNMEYYLSNILKNSVFIEVN